MASDLLFLAPWQDSNLQPAVWEIAADILVSMVQCGLGRSGWAAFLGAGWFGLVVACGRRPEGPAEQVLTVVVLA
jgi:hypothetical protein